MRMNSDICYYNYIQYIIINNILYNNSSRYAYKYISSTANPICLSKKTDRYTHNSHNTAV